MSDSYNNTEQNNNHFSRSREDNRNGARGGKGYGNREGGFRIRLSDNEMRAARSIQETFNLRSTVAVLGFALRTLAQLIEEGELNNFIEHYQPSNTNNRTNSMRHHRNRNHSESNQQGSFNEKTKVNPFERPVKAEVTTENPDSTVEKEEETLNQEHENPIQTPEK